MASSREHMLGRYRLVAKLATGGMGEIFLARLAGRAGFEKLVVIKRLLPELAPSGRFVDMFFDEARLAARLSHPNVCEVLDLGEDAGQYFLVMPFLEGVPFARAMGRDGHDAREHLRFVTGVMTQACEGLHHAHEVTDAAGRPLGVVHRDVSPSNLFVTAAGVVKVLDFGIAKARGASDVTEKGMLKGKLAYMSPEQLAEGAIDRRADVFCAGIVLHEAVTGRRLFHREPALLAAKAILEEDVPEARAVEPAVPAALSAVIARALARDPGERFASARELGRAVEDAMKPLGGPHGVMDVAAVMTRRFGAELDAQRARYRNAEAMPVPAAPEPATADSATPATVPGKGRVATDVDDAATRARARPSRSRRPVIALALGVIVAAAAVVAVVVTREGAGPRTHANAPTAAPTPAPVRSTLPGADAGLAIPEARPLPDLALTPPARPRPPRPGRVSIDSTPYAIIYMGERRLGETPLIEETLPPGRHMLRAVLPGGREQRFTVDVKAGATAPPVQLTW